MNFKRKYTTNDGDEFINLTTPVVDVNDNYHK